MDRWKLIAIVATALIVLSIPAYLFKQRVVIPTTANQETSTTVEFVGSDACKSCHKTTYDNWRGSHHDLAMDVANDETVLGDFNDAVFSHFGVETRFYRDEGRFLVHTAGPDGQMGEFEITHTFGVYPLQQYLVPFPGGRKQCLPIAWDARQNRWYHLYPDEPIDPDDWLYWTNAGQNWNGMCAECHSTNLKKNYDPEAGTYDTTWSQIDVGCEACHGPGSAHVRWAELPEMGRPQVDNYDLMVRTNNMTPREQIELCAPCHSRRMSLGDNTHDIESFMDYGIPQLLSEGMYFADGQILDEVYVYGSFMQSKMYDRDVRCADCHDVHSIKRIAEGNDLCLQCHRADIYDTKSHHFHKKAGQPGEPIRDKNGQILFEVGTGAQCEQCHMPGRNYMGIDYRPDHSFRIPRPDLTLKIGAPNACDRCHVDKPTQWSVDAIAKWYGERYRSNYGTTLHAGRQGALEVKTDLIRLADDRLYPVIVRATALSLLRAYSGSDVEQAQLRALADEAPLMRHTALSLLDAQPPPQLLPALVPMLYDPVKAVRIEAARTLAQVPDKPLDQRQQARYETVLAEYVQAMRYTADFAPSRHNLGNLYAVQGEIQRAVASYQAAIAIDDLFFPAKVNLAMIYNQQGKNDQAEKLLREVVKHHPQMYEVQYSLGLLLAERKKYQEAALYLSNAARGLPGRARVSYNLGVLMDYLQKDAEAEAALGNALSISPDNADFLIALAQFYLKRGRLHDAEPLAKRLVEHHPAHPAAVEISAIIEQEKANKKESLN
jgi:tetratricopeptide (TPR) repeat protein